ncbi:MAG: hypothetical protein ACE5HS_06060 [bacterium]
MNLLKILSTLRDFADFIIFGVIFVVILFLFLKEFKPTSKNSWAILLALIGMGGFFFFKAWQRKKLLEKFKEREEELKKLEAEYDELKEKAQITDEAYQKAKTALDQAKVQAGLGIMRADNELAERMDAIEKEFENMSVDDSLAKIEASLK